MKATRHRRFRFLAPLAAAACCLAWLSQAWAHADSTAQDAHHDWAAAKAIRSPARFVLPDVRLVRSDGHAVLLKDEIEDGRPIVLDFIYTTCSAVCPVSSQTFAELEQRLSGGSDRVHLMSVSIDPEQDTPRRMTEYAKRHGAGPAWNFYTGTLEASESVQRAFRVFRGSKMLHEPVTLLRPAPGMDWVRFDGFVTATELLQELPSQVLREERASR